MYRIILLILLLTSCSVYQPLEGLCYTDTKGTYICPKEDLVTSESISLREACDWIEFKTKRSITAAGLKKHIDKKYGKREQRIARLGKESTSLLDRF